MGLGRIKFPAGLDSVDGQVPAATNASCRPSESTLHVSDSVQHSLMGEKNTYTMITNFADTHFPIRAGTIANRGNALRSSERVESRPVSAL